MNQSYTDTEIIEGAKKGMDGILKYWYNRDYSYIKGYILSNSGTEEHAKEIYQDAFMVVYQKIIDGTFQSQATIKTFLYAVARNLWLKQLRDTKKVEKTEAIQDLQIAAIGEEYDWTIDEQEQELMEKLEQLGAGCQKLLSLFYFYKKSLRDIAKQLSYKDEKNARNAKYKCMQRLRKAFIGQEKK